jgi:hypothetical protein
MLRQGTGVHLPIYVPIGEDSWPPWSGFRIQSIAVNELAVALKHAEQLGDYNLQAACLKHLILGAEVPQPYLTQLAHLQISVQHDVEGHFRTLLSSFLICQTPATAESLRQQLKQLESDRRLPELPPALQWAAKVIISKLDGTVNLMAILQDLSTIQERLPAYIETIYSTRCALIEPRSDRGPPYWLSLAQILEVQPDGWDESADEISDDESKRDVGNMHRTNRRVLYELGRNRIEKEVNDGLVRGDVQGLPSLSKVDSSMSAPARQMSSDTVNTEIRDREFSPPPAELDAPVRIVEAAGIPAHSTHPRTKDETSEPTSLPPFPVPTLVAGAPESSAPESSAAGERRGIPVSGNDMQLTVFRRADSILLGSLSVAEKTPFVEGTTSTLADISDDEWPNTASQKRIVGISYPQSHGLQAANGVRTDQVQGNYVKVHLTEGSSDEENLPLERD